MLLYAGAIEQRVPKALTHSPSECCRDCEEGRQAMQIKAVVFDASGTILDDIDTVWRANLDAYVALGYDGPKTLEEFRTVFRLPVSEFHKANGIPTALLPEIDQVFRRSYPPYASAVKVFPEVEAVLSALQEQGKILGVVSNIPTLFLREHFRKLGINGYFHTVTGQEDCDEQKPSAKPILATLDKLGVKPRETVYVGDMEEDIIAGKRANVVTVAIVRGESYHPRWRLERKRPDFLITNLSELLLAFPS